MTDREIVDKYFDFLKAINAQGYSQTLMQMASNMFVAIPKESLEWAMKEFTTKAEQGLPECEYYYEISQVFKEIMGYGTKKAILTINVE